MRTASDLPRRLFRPSTSSDTNPRSRRRLRPVLERCEDRKLMAGSAYTVTTLSDTGYGSGSSGDLRYCIAHVDKTGGTINFAVTGTINLASALPAITSTQPVTITGPGANALSIVGVAKPTGGGYASFEGGILDITKGTTATITGLTLTGGSAEFGGALFSDSNTNLTLDGLDILNNTATDGGGIFTAGQLVLTNSTLSGNASSDSGSGMSSSDPTITNCTIANNRSAGRIGAAYLSDGGTLTNCTITGNDSGVSYDETNISSNPSPLVFNNTIIVGNTAFDVAAQPTQVDAADSHNNLIGKDTSGQFVTGTNANQVGVPLASLDLGLLAENGGPTPTIALLTGSIAVDAGDDALAPATDQRGVARGPANAAAGPHSDIGAFERIASQEAGLRVFTVTTLTDPIYPMGINTGRTGTLRYCITEANIFQGVIDFAVTGTITLTSALPAITSTQPFTITGPGANALTIVGPAKAPNGYGIFEGGIFDIINNTTATITGLTLTGGSAQFGGAIYGDTGTNLTLDGLDILNNTGGVDGGGGGIFTAGQLVLTNSTLSGNIDLASGGALFSSDPTITNCTIVNNVSGDGGAAFLYDGGTLTNCTVTGNNNGIMYEPVTGATPSPLVFNNTIIVGNTAFDVAAQPTQVDAADSHNNLIGKDTSGQFVTGTNANQVGVPLASLELGTLGNYGGSTPTLPLLPGSPALDAGDNATSGTTDQRGFARIVNRTVDIGAFESRGFTLTLVGNSSPQATPVGTAFANPLALVVASPYGEPVAGGVVTFRSIPGAGGAGVTLGATAVTILANGLAADTATANNVTGPSTVTAATSGAALAVTFSLSNQAAVAATVSVAWGKNQMSLHTAADGLRLLPAGRTTDIPWAGINRLSINLGFAAALTAANVAVTGASGLSYGPVTISASGTTYTITLARPINAADRVTLAIGNSGMATFTRRLDVLPGDVNDDGAVTTQDAIAIRNQYLGFSDAVPTAFGDLNGDGVVDVNDYNLARRLIGTVLP